MERTVPILNDLPDEYVIMDLNYKVYYYVDRAGNIYKRTGKCKLCGRCCVALRVENLNPENGMCKYLGADNKCVLHNTGKKPIHCRASPLLPIKRKGCGYKWKKVIF